MQTTSKIAVWLYAMLGLGLLLAFVAGDMRLFPWIYMVELLAGITLLMFLVEDPYPWNRVICDRHKVWVRVVGTLRLVCWGCCPVCKRRMRPEKEGELPRDGSAWEMNRKALSKEKGMR
jgi:hypothetical protein